MASELGTLKQQHGVALERMKVFEHDVALMGKHIVDKITEELNRARQNEDFSGVIARETAKLLSVTEEIRVQMQQANAAYEKRQHEVDENMKQVMGECTKVAQVYASGARRDSSARSSIGGTRRALPSAYGTR